MMSSAQSSLMETYTDSEDEEYVSKESIAISLPVQTKQPEVPKTKGPLSLVSYQAEDDDTITSDDELHDEATALTVTSAATGHSSSANALIDPMFKDVDLPPEPTGTCSSDLTKKIAEMTELMNLNGCDMNLIIQKRKSFRNPSMYEKLIEYCNINEFGTNYERRVYDPMKWGESSYYDELAKAQNAHMKRREKKKRGGAKVQFITGTATNSFADTKKKSKKR
ncbi:unnamed protein product [Nezara viridula]|uniref:SAP30-binding protein n=1 Tax=Nezara viridula TaxID=85310 RepID=A0A9P0EDA4_NEZVI|nr:unnamed protein product [Nezara viridula]